MNIYNVLFKLFRFRPTIAWSFCGILLGLAVALHEYGFGIMWSHVLIAVLPIILMQGFIAHAVNDLEDEAVDRMTNLSGTNRFKVLIAGIATRYELIILTLVIWTITLLAAITLYTDHGYPIAIFYSIALYAAIGYSLPPLKLGWRPYSEWTVVFPVLVTLVVAVDYIATGSFSYLAFVIGILFALFNIIWFLVSRMMDYEPDKAAGKRTTFVKYGLNCENLDSINHYLALVMLFLFSLIIYIIIFVNLLAGIISWLTWYAVYAYLPRNYDLSPKMLSVSRRNIIYMSIINSVIISLILILT